MVVATDRYLAEDAGRPGPGRVTRCCRRWWASRAAVRADAAVHDDMPDNVAAHMVQEPRRRRRRRSPPHRTQWTSQLDGRAVSASTPLEGKGVYARWDTDDRSLRVYSSTQTSTSVRLRPRRQARHPGRPGRGGRARRRRRLRGEDRAPVAGGGARPVGGDPARPRGQVGRGPARALHLGRPRAPARSTASGSASTPTAGCSGLDVTFLHDNGAYTPYGIIVPIITSTQLLGPVQAGHLPGRVPVPLHEHGHRHALPGRRPAARLLRHGAGDGRGRRPARASTGPSCGSATSSSRTRCPTTTG